MDFDFSWVLDPTPEELAEEGANCIQHKSAGAYPGYRTLNEESRKKISESLKGNIPWNKGLKGAQSHSEETKQEMSRVRKKYQSEEERLAARREAYQRYNRKRRGQS